MLIAVLNHERSDQTVELVRGFRPYADVFAIDSGSRLEAHHRPYFDLILPNVHYCAQINETYRELLKRPEHNLVYIITSDVRVPDYAQAVACAEDAFCDSRIGVYAPSTVTTGSGHPQMWNRSTEGLRPVVFVEGFCFATRVALLHHLCPIDTALNPIGWGVDVYLGYLARRAGACSVVDDRITVIHPKETTYDTKEARRQYSAWFARHSRSARLFQRLTGLRPMKTAFGARLVNWWTWR
jgi:hypothetical protein